MEDLTNYFIEDVIIDGFKSFSEQTAMTFQPGINVIIGNNGVGKSNIFDAISWAFGEDDLRKLRCYNEDELFFLGSRNHPPAQKISVEVKLSNKNNRKSNGINFRRELWKDGKTCYLIDGKQTDKQNFLSVVESCGLKDITRTIVRQDQISQIFQLEPEDRLSWLSKNYLYGIRSHCAYIKKNESDFNYYLSLLNPSYSGSFIIDKKKFDIEIKSNKGTRKIHQMSGGERSVVSLAFKLALFNKLKSPVFFLDEVEPSLDYVNHKQMQYFLKDISKNKQLVIITHLRATVEIADTLHGVRARNDGSTFMKFYFVMDKRLLRLYKCC